MQPLRFFCVFLVLLIATGTVLAQPQAACPAGGEPFQLLRQRVMQADDAHVSVVAHRGCFAVYPENSLRALEECARMGVEVVENDVRRTADGQLVVFHDADVGRMTDGWGFVGDMTLAELKALRLRERDGGPDAFLTDHRIPTLEEYMGAARGKVMINMEIKQSGANRWPDMYRQVVEMAARMHMLDHVLFKVPDATAHGRLEAKSLLEDLDLGTDRPAIMPIVWESSVPLDARLEGKQAFGPDGYELVFQDPAYIQGLRSLPAMQGRPRMAIAVQPYWSGGLDDRLSMRDPAAGWGRLVELGVTMIMTDRPEPLLDYLNASGHRQPPGCTPADRVVP